MTIRFYARLHGRNTLGKEKNVFISSFHSFDLILEFWNTYQARASPFSQNLRDLTAALKLTMVNGAKISFVKLENLERIARDTPTIMRLKTFFCGLQERNPKISHAVLTSTIIDNSGRHGKLLFSSKVSRIGFQNQFGEGTQNVALTRTIII